MEFKSLVVTSLTVLLNCLWFIPEAEGATFMFVGTNSYNSGQCVDGFGPSDQINLKCQYHNEHDRPLFVEVGHNTPLPVLDTSVHQFPALLYTLPRGTRGQHTYKCQDSTTTAIITLSISTPCDGAIVTLPNTVPTRASSSSNSVRPPTNPTGGGQKFSGLNPLIYTISAVILLGTLAIVSIITCWIRARRSFNNRVLRANNTPQDYLDYISDNEFTPLTTSEFVASLQERPPTYHESEQIEQDARSGENTEEEMNIIATNTSTTEQPGGGSGSNNPPPWPPPPTRPLPPIPTTSSQETQQNTATNDSSNATSSMATLVQPTLSNLSPVTSILDVEVGSEAQLAMTSPSQSEQASLPPAAVAIGTLIDVGAVEQSSSVSSPPQTLVNSPPLLVDDLFSLTPYQFGSEVVQPRVEGGEGGNVHLVHYQELPDTS